MRHAGTVVGAAALFALGSCSNSSESGAPEHPQPQDPLFTSSSVLRCGNGKPLTQFSGTIDGQKFEMSFTNTDVEPRMFQILTVPNGVVLTTLTLTWDVPLTEDTAIAVTGGSLVVPDGQPHAGETLCITKGTFGSPAIGDAQVGREILFEITGARVGDCNGAEVPIDLGGCVVRGDSYFPYALSASTAYKSVTPPQIDPSTPITSLTQEQAAALCDWQAESLGGYDTLVACANGTGSAMSDHDQAVCISGLPRRGCLGQTVGELETCIRAIAQKNEEACAHLVECDPITRLCP